MGSEMCIRDRSLRVDGDHIERWSRLEDRDGVDRDGRTDPDGLVKEQSERSTADRDVRRDVVFYGCHDRGLYFPLSIAMVVQRFDRCNE